MAVISLDHHPSSHPSDYSDLDPDLSRSVSEENDLELSVRERKTKVHTSQPLANGSMATITENEHFKEDIFDDKMTFDELDDEEENEKVTSCCWPFSLLSDRPVLRLFVVMFLNGLISLAAAALIMEIEYPEQVR